MLKKIKKMLRKLSEHNREEGLSFNINKYFVEQETEKKYFDRYMDIKDGK